jgi:hypothetical protein
VSRAVPLRLAKPATGVFVVSQLRVSKKLTAWPAIGLRPFGNSKRLRSNLFRPIIELLQSGSPDETHALLGSDVRGKTRSALDHLQPFVESRRLADRSAVHGRLKVFVGSRSVGDSLARV